MEALVECMSFDYPTAPRHFYCVYDINELNDDVSNENKSFPVIGLGDFFFFNLLLLFVLPVNSSIPTRVCTALICIITVQLGDLCTTCLIPYVNNHKGLPALPFPTVFVTAYAIVVDVIIQYSDIGCENPLK
jgi:hypothetical protein